MKKHVALAVLGLIAGAGCTRQEGVPVGPMSVAPDGSVCFMKVMKIGR